MYIDHFKLQTPPFSESPDPEVFFPGSRREQVCRSLNLDILGGKPLLKLVGKEGSGKTLLCRLLETQLSASARVVVLDNPVGSFEDLLRLVCIDLGATTGSALDQRAVLPELQRMLKQVHEQGLRVVLVIDEAEKMFPAALERLIRHVGEETGDLKMTLLLVGRCGLDTHLQQMSSLNPQAFFSNAYALEDLSESETRQYLRFRATAAGMSREHFAEVFTDGAVTKIFKAAQGNLRLVNILAEEALQNYCAEKSFMVLLDHVEPEAVKEPAGRQSRSLLGYRWLRAHPLPIGALACCLLLICVWLFNQEELPQSATKNGLSSPQSPQAPRSVPVFTNARPGSQQAQVNGEAVFRQRMEAAANWQNGPDLGKYTIQLMMLSSPSARFSLSATLATGEYAPIVDQLYILEKRTQPLTLFVFYGVYDTMEAAREARNGMPVFLRKHQPYPLVIGEAVRKVVP